MTKKTTKLQLQQSRTEKNSTAGIKTIKKRFLHATNSMNEAYDYPKPSAFSRGIEIQLGEFRLILVSGTASVGQEGQTLHKGDFHAQALRMYENARAVLKDAGADWHDVVKTTIFIKDISAYYEMFNEIRCSYFKSVGLKAYPASTCVEARLCRDDLLVEMESMAIVQNDS